MKISTFTKLSYALAALPMTMGLFSSCADQDFDWEGARMQNVEYAYRKNFEKAFGEIKPDQSWDFSSSAKQGGTRASAGIVANMTQVGSPTGAEWYQVNNRLLTYINENFPEKGTSWQNADGGGVMFTVPSTPFTVYPIFQGLALNWDLYMTVGQNDSELIWKKSQDIQRYDGTRWVDLGLDDVAESFLDALEWNKTLVDGGLLNYKNGKKTSKTYYGWDYVYGSSGNANEIGYKTTTLKGENTTESAPVRTKGYKFDLRGHAGEPLYFHLEVNARSKFWRNVSLGTRLSSLSNQMRFVNPGFSLPEFDGKDVYIIGIEDSDYRYDGQYLVDCNGDRAKRADGTDADPSEYPFNNYERYEVSDFDYNDLMLIIVADHLETETTSYDVDVPIRKRYMVEDLGATDDIDFNDMVVDVEEIKTYHHEITYSGGKITNHATTLKSTSQTAHVRALGGTLDFDFYIGNELVYSKSEHQSWNEMINTGWENTSIDYEAELTSNSTSINLESYGNPWNPSENNIKFVVYRDKKPRTEGGTTWKYENWVNTGSYAHTSNITYTEDEKKVLIGFPEPGQTPYIIAVDTDKQWRNERRPVCAHWLVNKNFSTTEDCEACAGNEHGNTEANKPTNQGGVINNGSAHSDPSLEATANRTSIYAGGLATIQFSTISDCNVSDIQIEYSDVVKVKEDKENGVLVVRANTAGTAYVRITVPETAKYASESKKIDLTVNRIPAISFEEGETELWDGNTGESTWNDNPKLSMQLAKNLSEYGVNKGSTLRFYLTVPNPNDGWGAEIVKNSNWEIYNSFASYANPAWNLADHNGAIEITIDDSNIDMLNENIFRLNGNNVICTKITLLNNSVSTNLTAESTKNTVYSGGLFVVNYETNSNGEVSVSCTNAEQVGNLDTANKRVLIRAINANQNATVVVNQAKDGNYEAASVTVNVSVNALPTVTLSPAEVSVWNDNNNKKQFGNPLVNNNNYTQYTFDLKNALTNNGANTNCKLRFYITPNENSWAVQIRKSDWNTKYTETSSLTNGYIELNLTQEMINDGKFTFNAIGMTCTQVTLVKEEIDLKNYTAYFKLVSKQSPDYRTISYNYKPTWGSDDYGQVLVKSTDGIRNLGLTTNSKLVFYKTRTSKGQIMLNNQDSGNWSESYGGASDYSGDSDYIIINFNQNLINRINSNAYYAFVIQGDGLEITKIAIIK